MELGGPRDEGDLCVDAGRVEPAELSEEPGAGGLREPRHHARVQVVRLPDLELLDPVGLFREELRQTPGLPGTVETLPGDQGLRLPLELGGLRLRISQGTPEVPRRLRVPGRD